MASENDGRTDGRTDGRRRMEFRLRRPTSSSSASIDDDDDVVSSSSSSTQKENAGVKIITMEKQSVETAEGNRRVHRDDSVQDDDDDDVSLTATTTTTTTDEDDERIKDDATYFVLRAERRRRGNGGEATSTRERRENEEEKITTSRRGKSGETERTTTTTTTTKSVVDDLGEGLGAFTLGRSTSSPGTRRGGGRGGRRAAGGGRLGSWSAFAAKLDDDDDDKVKKGATVMGEKPSSSSRSVSGKSSPTFEFSAMPGKGGGVNNARPRSASMQNVSEAATNAKRETLTPSSSPGRAATTTNEEENAVLRTTVSEPATSAAEEASSPEPMAVDSPNGSDASSAFGSTPPPQQQQPRGGFSMGSGGGSTGGSKKSTSFRNRASSLRVETPTTTNTSMETPGSMRSDSSAFGGASPASPVFASPTPKKFEFAAPPPSKPSPRKSPPNGGSAEKPPKSPGLFSMGSEEKAPSASTKSRSFKYAQRAGREKRSVGSPTAGPADVSQLSRAAAKISIQEYNAEETERLRQQGNTLYREQKYAEADAMYSKAIIALATAPRTDFTVSEADANPLGAEFPTFAGRAAAVLLTNRAAARMMIPSEMTPEERTLAAEKELLLQALMDCEHAIDADATYARAFVRAAGCHMKMAAFEDALALLEGGNVPEDAEIEKAAVEAKAMLEHLNKINIGLTKLRDFDAGLPRMGSDELAHPLDEARESLVQSVAALSAYPAIYATKHAKTFIETKALLLNACGAYHEACTFISEIEKYGMKDEAWMPKYTFTAYFGKGDLRAAIEYADQATGRDLDPELVSMAKTMMKGKDEGNALFNAKKYADAVKAYTVAFEAGTSPIAAAYCSVVLGNRAAAYQGLNETLNALADCGRALSFNPWNVKALSRRSSIHESIRCWDDAANDLKAYIQIAGRTNYDLFSSAQERRNALALATERLRAVEPRTQAQAHSQVDMYQILGLSTLRFQATAADIKKAYRALALKFHPDKSNRNMHAWVPAQALHDDADRLFKLLGETNAQLGDPALRRVFDETERIRDASQQRRTFTRSSTWSASSARDFQYGQDVPWTSAPRRKPRVNREKTGNNYYWDF
jgi:tetratricopeptide (TPR) repeat protein